MNRLSLVECVEQGVQGTESTETRRGADTALISTSATDFEDGGRRINPTPELTTYNIKLGWIQGVLIPCLLNIWGVMLFLRIAWIVAQAGIGLTVVIIMLSGVVCIITTLSLSAICTNGVLKGGGVYYIVSRSLGAELGASVGIIFAFANAVAASMNTIGFCDSLNELLRSFNMKIIDNGMNDVRIVGAIALLVMCLICAVGMDWETRTQNFLIAIIIMAIFNYILGACLGPSSDYERAQGFVGITKETVKTNFAPDYRQTDGQQHDFFSVFAMYFPAITGVQAGANICGDLKDPATAIPKGTLLALAISMTSYLSMAVLSGAGSLRDASGKVSDITGGTLDACKPHCIYGLHNNYAVMQLMSAWGPLIYAGCWAATLSTALTNLLSVPRLVQALGSDRIYPGLIFFSKPYGRHGEPYRGYVLTFLVSLTFLLIADLNTIAPLITNFYLASYALINFCTFHASLIKSINWRPTFRYYNTWLSLFGFLMCIIIMMIISWAMALITFLIFMTLYLLVVYRQPDVNWGGSADAQRYKNTVSSLLLMSHIQENTKSYNPQLLVLAGKPWYRPALLDFGHMITQQASFMIVADVDETPISTTERLTRLQFGEEWLRSRKHRSFYVVLDGMLIDNGVHAVIKLSGLGSLKPNIMLIGYLNRWMTCAHTSIRTYVRILHIALEEQLGVAILRVPKTARPVKSELIPETVMHSSSEEGPEIQVQEFMYTDSDINMAQSEPLEGNSDETSELELEVVNAENVASFHPKKNSLSAKKRVSSLAMRKSGVYKPLKFTSESEIHTWWLFDDGGLNILLPYIMAMRSFRDKLPLCIHALPRDSQDSGYAKERYWVPPINLPVDSLAKLLQHTMSLFRLKAENNDVDNVSLCASITMLLQNLRIEYSSLTMIEGLEEPPLEASVNYFEKLISKFKSNLNSDVLISEIELKRLERKTNRYLRLRELLVEKSYTASFIVVSLPHPGLGRVPAALYMAWLQLLSQDLPPVLFLRGTRVSVIST